MPVTYAPAGCLIRALLRKVHRDLQALPALCTLLLLCNPFTDASAGPAKWVGTWSTAPQLVEPNNNPPSPGLSHNTLRQIVRVSLGGDTLRMRFSNEFSTSPVTLNEVHLALSLGQGAIEAATDRVLLFNGKTTVTMEPGAAAISDPLPFSLQPRTDVAITIHFAATSADVTGHPGSRTTSYLLAGDQTSRADFSGAVRTDHWYVIHTIDVKAPDSSAAIVLLGDSITDGRGSGTNQQNRWPDELARRLQENPLTQQVAVLNQGIGGNCVLGSCLGPSALNRFERDVLAQSSVRWLIILHGINDIGGAQGTGVGSKLIGAYTSMIHSAHAHGILVYGATLLPMGGSSYDTPAHEAERQIVNQWIRRSGLFDAVIDLDRALRSPADTLRLRPEADTGDHLHPNETGHRLMAEAVDLQLFMGRDTVTVGDMGRPLFFEAECATVGNSWQIIADVRASQGRYVTVLPGLQSLAAAPGRAADLITVPFTVNTTGVCFLFARMNGPSGDDDSFWVKMDQAGFQMHNGLGTNGWEWKRLNAYSLTEGGHTLTMAYREDGAKLDKLCLSNQDIAPLGMGGEAENMCTSTGGIPCREARLGFALKQNHPNPWNPITSIPYYLPRTSRVTLEVLDLAGRTVKTLIHDERSSGEHTVDLNGSDLASGLYFYRLRTTDFIQSRKMLLVK